MSVKFHEKKRTIEICGDKTHSIRINMTDFKQSLIKHEKQDPLTGFAESMASKYVCNKFPVDQTFLIVRLICAWGGIRGKNSQLLYVQNNNDNFVGLTNKLRHAHEVSMKGEYEHAIAALAGIDGTGISFRSKFLRFLCPDHAAVLDSRIRERLHYEHSPEGYHSFVNDCKTIKEILNKNDNLTLDRRRWRVCDVEMAIFMKIKG